MNQFVRKMFIRVPTKFMLLGGKKLEKLNKYTFLVLLLLAGLMLTSAGISVFVKNQPVSQRQVTSELNVQVVEIGQSEVQPLQAINETPIPVYYLNSSRMFTILYLRMNFTGTTTVDGNQLTGQPTIILDGSVFPIRSRYNEFKMFLTLTQGMHIVSLVNIGVSGNSGAYDVVFSHTSFLIQVGPLSDIPTFSSFQISYVLNVTYDPSRDFNRNQAHLDQALVRPTIFDGNYTIFNATLEGTGFFGDLSASATFSPVQGIVFLQTANGMHHVPASATEETIGFGDHLPVTNFISIYPVGYDPTSRYYANMAFFEAEAISFRGLTNGSLNLSDPSTSTGITTKTEPQISSSNPITTSESLTNPAFGLPIALVPAMVAVAMVILRRKKR